MIELDHSELALIEEIIDRYRQRLTNAAIKRKQRAANRKPRPQRILSSVEDQIHILERFSAGETYTSMAKSLNCHPQHLRYVIHWRILRRVLIENKAAVPLYGFSLNELRTKWTPLVIEYLRQKK